MVRLAYRVTLGYQVESPDADFMFAFQAARTRQQQVVNERLVISQALMPHASTDAATHTRLLRLKAFNGPLTVHYEATVDVMHQMMAPTLLAEVPVARLPDAVLPYLYPSRYCESDRLHSMAVAQFGTLWQGHGRVMAIRDWVRRQVTFRSNTSQSTTSALDTLSSRQGVCRDFAHLMIALCRAVNIPARFVTGLDYGADPILGPPDFHAYVETWLGDRWWMFDPSGTAIPMGFVRIATGRDAADAAFATIFGSVRSDPPIVHTEALPDDNGVIDTPRHRDEALSTAGL